MDESFSGDFTGKGKRLNQLGIDAEGLLDAQRQTFRR